MFMQRNLVLAGLACALTLACGTAYADLVHLKNGKVIEGKTRRENGKVYITQPNGTIIISEDRVDFIEPKDTALDIYFQKYKAIDETKDGAAGEFVKLARWCNDKSMNNQAAECYQKALALDPDNAEAHVGIGQVKVNGVWLNADDANVARGLVKYGDSWVTPEAKSDLLKLEAQKALLQQQLELDRVHLETAQAEAERAKAEADRAHTDADRYRNQIDYDRYRWVGQPVSPYIYYPPTQIGPSKVITTPAVPGTTGSAGTGANGLPGTTTKTTPSNDLIKRTQPTQPSQITITNQNGTIYPGSSPSSNPLK